MATMFIFKCPRGFSESWVPTCHKTDFFHVEKIIAVNFFINGLMASLFLKCNLNDTSGEFFILKVLKE